MMVMALERRAGWLAAAGFVAIGCAHARTQQAEVQPQPAPSKTAAVTPPAAATPTAASVPVAAPPQSPPGSGADAVAVTVPVAAAADFAHDVRPIFEKRCQPCHFEGGKMYERLPFDRPETIKSLGTKLFTRIKAEDEQAVIRRFLAQGS
jgi:hypothetical protein